MKKLKTIFLIAALQIMSVGFLSAQTLSEKLGAVKTEFIITSHGEELEVTNQVIAKRAERYYDWGRYDDSVYGYGYGYESFHLEFSVTNGEIDLPQPGGLLKKEKLLVLDFYDENNNFIGSRRKALREVRRIENGMENDKLIHYTIDLINIPLPVLDAAKRIDFYREN